MKKKFLLIASLTIIVSVTLFSSCFKDDVTPPVIKLNGSSTINLLIGSSYTDAGAIATDDKDGNITSLIKTDYSDLNPNMNLAGTYTINYSVSDAAGNSSSVKRIVNVFIKPTSLAGNWIVADTIRINDTLNDVTPYTDVLTASLSDTSISVTKFASYSGAAIKFKLSGTCGTTITMPAQTVVCTSDNHSRTFSGYGTVFCTDSITIFYSKIDNTALDTINGIEVYTRKSKK